MIAKASFYGEPNSGVRDHNERRGKGIKTAYKENQKKLDMNKTGWENDTLDRKKWRGAVRSI